MINIENDSILVNNFKLLHITVKLIKFEEENKMEDKS